METCTILLVEDHAAVRRLVRFALERAGMRVVEAENGTAALALVKSEAPQLVIQDLILPDIDGFELVARLRSARGDAPLCVLAFSGLISNLDQGRILAAGFDDVIPKPCDPSTLVSIVESHLPGGFSAAGRFGEGKRVVVADDDPGQLRLTCVRLASLGFRITEAHDGAEALALIRETTPDLVVSDVMMPRVDGFDLALSLRKDPRLRHIPLVLLSSSYLEQSDRELARNAGADEFVLRTPDLGGLIEALHRTISEGNDGARSTVLPHEELERQHGERVVRQLERQVRQNAALMRRCSALSTELDILRRISEAVLRQRNVEAELDDVLATCFDAGGASAGALYLQNADGSLRVIPLGTARFVAEDLHDFFGNRPWLLELMHSGQSHVLVDGDEASVACKATLARAAAVSALVVPLVHMNKVMGALFMAHLGRDQSVDVLQWRVFAQGVSNQITLALTLANAFQDLEAAQREAIEQRGKAREQAALWRALVENAPDVIMNLDREGHIHFINRAPPGRSIEDMALRCWHDLAAPDHRETRAKALRAVFAAGKPASIETAGSTSPDGQTAWVESHLGPIFTASEVTGVVVIERDVTQKRQTEAQLIVSDRMASVGTLAAGVAHEINNPLASVITNLDLAARDAAELMERTGFTSELIDELNDAREGAERVRRIVKDLKIFSRVDEDKHTAVDVERVLESTLRMAWNEVRHRAQLVKDYQKIPLVEANESRLGQVFLNLIVNAAQAIEEGNASRNEIRVRTYEDAQGFVVVSVSDTGSGIPESMRARLFTPFVTTKPPGVGTGLGLSICHRIVTSLGGHISVDSEPGKGTEFRVMLPKAKPDSLVPEIKNRPAAMARRRGKVLVVDDEPLITKVVRRTLGREHEVDALNSAEDALCRIRSGERFDVILCDLMMPQVTGMDFHAELERAYPEQAAKMVFLTGGAFTPKAREFLENVQNHRVEKPIDAQGLKALVNDMLRSA
jgi:PAS domain S-box-containing protein